jgi:hypothetical protein
MRATLILSAAVFGIVACHESPHGQSITSSNLRGVWGSGPADIWVVGDKGTILHYDGKTWASSPSGTEEDLTGVAGTGPTNVYVSGQKGAILHWDGKVWRQVSEGPDTTLVNLWVSGPDEVWAVGIGSGDEGGTMRRLMGGKWENQDILGSSSLWGVGGSGPSDVWMVGDTSRGQGYVIHGDGKHFDANGYKAPTARAVWSGRPDDVWVAPYQGALQHWNGTAWTAAATPEGPWYRMGGSGSDDVWAVGANGVTAHLHGGTWTTPATGTTEIIWSIWSSSPTSAWAVGNGGTVLFWNGSAWVR